MKHILFFDLDGTLTDSAEGITNCVKHALTKQNWPIPSDTELRGFIGPPLIDSFQTITGMNVAQATQAIKDYRERYAAIGLFENRAYDGIIPMLSDLKRARKRLFMVTSKPEIYSKQIAERFGFAPYLEQICGATLDRRINSKDAVVALALERAGYPDPSDIEMIGDRLHDVDGSRIHGIDCTYVLYGFGNRAEAEAHHASHIVATVEELHQYLLTI